MDAFVWSVIGAVAGVVGTGAVIVFGVIPLWQSRNERHRANAGRAESRLQAGEAAEVQPSSHLVDQADEARVKDQQATRPAGAPRVWNLPARNPRFTGRDGLLMEVRKRLVTDDRAVVQAFAGMGGVGKTQMAVEYAYRFAGGYDLAWWVDAEQPALIGDQFAALGAALGCLDTGAAAEVVRQVVLGELRARGRWLLVFDNADGPADVRRWLPGGDGHVLITSRQHGWDDVAAPVEVDVLDRPESVAMMRDRVTGLDEEDADRLADRLGDLPLALSQAAGFMAETGMPLAGYLELLDTQAARLLDESTPGSYPRPLAAATRLAVDRLAADDPAAAQLAELCAFLGPEPIPEDLFTASAGKLPVELAARAIDPLAWRQTLGHLTRRSLARVDGHGLVMHRLTQAILRDRAIPARGTATRECTEAVLAEANPGDPPNPGTWPRWARLMPHLIAADLAATRNADLRAMACDACWYLLVRGDAHAAHDLAGNLRRHWRQHLGEDDKETLMAMSYLAWALSDLGHYAEAQDLDRATLKLRRTVLGNDHPDTLTSANNLADDFHALGKVQEACDLDRDTLRRRRKVLGPNHPDTLTSASNVATRLFALHYVQDACDLDRDTLNRRRKVLGPNHPDTLTSAGNLATRLFALHKVDEACDLDRDTLNRRRKVLGPNHPDTLTSASNVAADLRATGKKQAAYMLDRDTLIRRRQVLGPNHPDTLASASRLAADLRALGKSHMANKLDRDTLIRRRLSSALAAQHIKTRSDSRQSE